MTHEITLRPCVRNMAEAMEKRFRVFDGEKRFDGTESATAFLSRGADRAYLAKVATDSLARREYAVDAANLVALAMHVMDNGPTDKGVNYATGGPVSVTIHPDAGFARRVGRLVTDAQAASQASAHLAEVSTPTTRAAETARSYADEAVGLVTGPRQEDYSHPLEDFTRTAGFWSQILGIEVRPDQVALCMVGVKLSREIHKHKRDNLIDALGYLLTDAMVLEEDSHG